MENSTIIKDQYARSKTYRGNEHVDRIQHNSPFNTKYVVIDYKSHSIYWRSINLSCYRTVSKSTISTSNHPTARFFVGLNRKWRNNNDHDNDYKD